MEVSPESLKQRFSALCDAELQRLLTSHDLTELAQELARAELATRGAGPLAPPPEVLDATRASAHGLGAGHLLCVRRTLSPVHAQLQWAFLNARGVPAVLFDVNMVQVNLLYAIALGGVRIMVPARYLAEARELLAAYERGEFWLDENSDIPDQEESTEH